MNSYAGNYFEGMVKGVVDLSKGILALDAELHADLEAQLLSEGSRQEDLWGINLYPDEDGEEFIEFDSIINIRSWQNNPSRFVVDPEIRERIKSLVAERIR